MSDRDLDAVKVVKDGLADKLMDGVLCRRNVNGVGLSKDEYGWFIKVNLVKPQRWWHRRVPTEYRGVRVKTQVIGVVRAC